MRRGLSRAQLFRRLHVFNIIDPILESEYGRHAMDEHGPDRDPWHTAFHASSFPYPAELGCGRKAVYALSNFGKEDSISTQSRAIMEAGVDIELRQVTRFHTAGVLLSEAPGEPQTTYVDPAHWLVGHSDAVILPPGWQSPHPVEIKGKDHEAVLDMLGGKKQYDPPHLAQVMCYMYLGRRYEWRLNGKLLLPIEDGSILYVSRARPRTTAEFYFRYDEPGVQKSLALLASWIDDFVDNKLPGRPNEWRWTQEPCKWCSYKRGCKVDLKARVDTISESCLHDATKKADPSYDNAKTREKVLNRWKRS